MKSLTWNWKCDLHYWLTRPSLIGFLKTWDLEMHGASNVSVFMCRVCPQVWRLYGRHMIGIPSGFHSFLFLFFSSVSSPNWASITHVIRSHILYSRRASLGTSSRVAVSSDLSIGRGDLCRVDPLITRVLPHINLSKLIFFLLENRINSTSYTAMESSDLA